MKKSIIIIISIIILQFMIPFTVFASNTSYENITVGTTKTLRISGYETGARNFRFTSSDPYSLDVVSQNNTPYCDVKATKMPGSNPVIIHCEYEYPKANGSYTYYITGMKDIYVTVSESSSGSNSGNYTISASSTSMNLDMSKGYGVLIITSGVVLSSDVYIKENSSSGKYVSISANGTNGNEAEFIVYPNAVGKQTVQFQLIQKTGTNSTSIRSKVNVSFNVTCSHVYDKGKITKEATAFSEGVMTYTCRNCGNTKTESIPKITDTDISTCQITISSSDPYVYDGNPKIPSVSVKNDTAILTEDTDYTLTYSNNVNAGTALITVSGKGIYTGSAKKTFEIEKAEQTLTASISEDNIVIGDKAQITANGIGTIDYSSSDEHIITVDDGGTVIGVSSGKAIITVTAAGNDNYNQASKKLDISVTEIPTHVSDDPTIVSSLESVKLKPGESQTITISANGVVPSDFTFSASKEGTGYNVSWTGEWDGNSHPLTIKGTAVGKGVLTIYLKNYTSGEKLANVQIPITIEAADKKNISDCQIILESEDSYIYDGTPKKPSVTAKDGAVTLKENNDYTLTYSNNINVGTASVTITGMGAYTGTAGKSFKIEKADQNLSAVISENNIVTGNKTQVTAEGVGSINYSSKDTGVATVNSSGVVVGISAGKTIILVTAEGDENYKSATKEIEITITNVSTTEKTTISSSVESVNLKSGESRTITITASGNLPSNYYFSAMKGGLGYTTSWTGSWNGSSHLITITGTSEGSGILTIYLRDSVNEEKLTSVQILVTVDKESSETTPTITSSVKSVRLRVGSNETINIIAGGALPAEYSFVASRYKDGYSMRWTGNWYNETHPLTITGTEPTNDTLIVYLKDLSTGEYLEKVQISITVI